ncbi:unnamed protein product [Caenorhabditis angaria]|uniref:MH2 domain-containing protein n=1 Tax=Caenorhabditis angaria TaxID=860376 RepID=A0A9P1J614_9PELO|nr:unnamed protein product [Caenorhabditis angaria]
MENGVSRSSLVHGTQTNPNSDTWYDTDSFLLDQVKEVLNKLSEGAIDDEIWGKIVIMERCKRVAKAYLRKTTVIIDGSEDEFDGRTLGFNHFENLTRDEYTKEIRAKIADGVILKMDYQGNIKGMARGATPIFCQGWKEPRNNCISDRLVRLHGKLNHVANEDEKAYKVFDMRKFKHSLERDLHDASDARTLLLKTCMRMALVKEGGDMNRTPCWFAIVNLVALDMVKEKVPMIMSLLNGNSMPMTVKSPPPSHQQESLDAQTLTQIIAAAVSQANKSNPPPPNTSNQAQNLSISPEQLAQIASTISIAQSNTLRTADLTTINKKERISYIKKPYHCSTSSLDSSGEDSTTRRPDIGVKSRAKRWEQSVPPKQQQPEVIPGETKIMEKTRPVRAANRPLLQDVIFTRSQSITSDYDSNKEHFDSGSWSSTQSRYKGGRSTASSVVSDHELTVITRDELKELNEMNEALETTEEEEEPQPTPPSNSPPICSPSSQKLPVLPEKDYNLSPTNFTFSPKFEGAPAWKSSATRYEGGAAAQEARTNETTPPPPPLPNTPLPPGLPASTPAYNNNNNAFKSSPIFYERERHREIGIPPSQLHTRSGEEMEIYFGRTPQPTQSSDHRFVNELRQVLEQRTSGLRIARNHSQPAAAHPNLQRYAITNPNLPANTTSHTTAGRNTPIDRGVPYGSSTNTTTRTTSPTAQSYNRGLRRTPNTTTIGSHQQHPQQHNQNSSNQYRPQRYPQHSYCQTTLCRDQAPAVRVNRTGSLPWGQWNMRRAHM